MRVCSKEFPFITFLKIKLSQNNETIFIIAYKDEIKILKNTL